MAKIVTTYEADKQTTVLSVRGRDFTLTMRRTDYGVQSDKPALENQLEVLSDIPEEILDLIADNIPNSAFEMSDLVDALNNYEEAAK